MRREVLMDCDFLSAGTTQNSFRIPFIFWPDHGLMPRCFLMTAITGIILITAFEFDGDNIRFRMIMNTPRLLVNRLSANDVLCFGIRIHFKSQIN